MYTKSELLSKVIKVIPYPDQMSDFDLMLHEQIRFTWRSVRFRVSLSGMVEEVNDVFLSGSNVSILLEALIKSDK